MPGIYLRVTFMSQQMFFFPTITSKFYAMALLAVVVGVNVCKTCLWYLLSTDIGKKISFNEWFFSLCFMWRQHLCINTCKYWFCIPPCVYTFIKHEVKTIDCVKIRGCDLNLFFPFRQKKGGQSQMYANLSLKVLKEKEKNPFFGCSVLRVLTENNQAGVMLWTEASNKFTAA